MIVLFIVIAILSWCIVSCIHAYLIMGDKWRKDKWYDLPLLLPALAIVTVIAWCEEMS